MPKRTQTKAMRDLLRRVDRCELCGDTRNLEVHHIIPVCCWGSENENNLIVICGSCHAKLSPKSELSAAGIKHARVIPDAIKSLHIRFYEMAGDLIQNNAENFSWPDVMDACVSEAYVACGVTPIV